MGWVDSEDFKRILKMGKELERIKRDAKVNRVLERKDRVDYWFTVLCTITCALFILFGLLRIARELEWWLNP